MKIGDKAEASDSPEVRLANDSIGLYKLESDDIVEADEIGTDEFPKYGDFVEVSISNGGREASWDEIGYVEIPGDLAKQLVDQGVGVGDCFRVQSCRKNGAGQWVYDVIAVDDPLPS